MSRIEPDRPGYDGTSGFECVGIPILKIEDLDCHNNMYKKLPMLLYGGMHDIPWEELDKVTAKCYEINQLCDLDYDPFFGYFMDLYHLFLEAGMGHVITDACYESTDIYGPGFMNPNPKAKIAGTPCKTLQPLL